MSISTPDPEFHPQIYASIPTKRFLAWCVDFAVIFAVSVLVVVLTAFTGLLIWPVLWLCIGFAYRVITLASGSATWGMALMGMELRDGRDRPFDLSMAVLHTGGYTVQMAMPLLQLISIVLICTTARHQGLTDHILGTVPMNRRTRG